MQQRKKRPRERARELKKILEVYCQQLVSLSLSFSLSLSLSLSRSLSLSLSFLSLSLSPAPLSRSALSLTPPLVHRPLPITLPPSFSSPPQPPIHTLPHGNVPHLTPDPCCSLYICVPIHTCSVPYVFPCISLSLSLSIYLSLSLSLSFSVPSTPPLPPPAPPPPQSLSIARAYHSKTQREKEKKKSLTHSSKVRPGFFVYLRVFLV